MDINVSMVPYLFIFFAIIPALLAVRLAKKQKRSALTSGVLCFVLGFTGFGGWLYLAIMNLLAPKVDLNS
ncbi:hypothetical protein J7384_15650 [Endozoicomonas sp. G2_1]|uniref:hypothetical protein n=1 Tax=Endozoicomonas sp. G2_1 TaxID=2821091 RepID=UPI001ADA90C0|nr:hypothetical protein [Endozoicomonas sp. G2_1]MBO9491794.1 hypothetical protein [Endozoicomonas sp. G2_1]